MGTVRFNIRTDKANKQGRSPIELVYQVEGQRKYFGTGFSIYPVYWEQTSQKAIYKEPRTVKKQSPDLDKALYLTSKEVETFNQDLNAFRKHVGSIESRFTLDKIPYTCSMVIDKLKEESQKATVKEAKTDLLFDFIDQYISEHSTTREEGSLQTYRSLKKHLYDYQRHTRKRILFEKIDYAFFQSFQTFLISPVGTTTNRKGEIVPRVPLTNSTAAKQLSTIKTFLNYARKNGIDVSDKYKDFTVKRELLEVIALTNKEFESVYYLDLSKSNKLAKVRDLFCFGCTTGLRFSDLAQLKWEHIKEDEIKLTVTKTKQPLTIPLTPFSRAIIERYKGQAKPLPHISNQKMNDYLKQLCKLAGISEPIEIVRFQGSKRIVNIYPKYELIGSHTGRKTFATLSLEKGMSAEQVMSIGGWKDYKSFKRYVNVTDQLKKTVMLKAWGGGLAETKLKAI